MKVAVIIPFFQRTPGLLATALASVAAQRVGPGTRVDILVIDDGSPVSAASERQPTLPPGFSLAILTRRNGGVAAARNTGLDAVAADTDYVAFLDSDDVWAPEHLPTGLAALADGADFYFDNTDDDGKDHLGSSSRLRQRHGPLDPANPITASIYGRLAFDEILAENIPQTSQVIYDFQHHGAIRFEESLKLASEDFLFWLSLANQSQRTSYHTGIMGRRGRGVSIYRSTLAWDSQDGLKRVIDQISMRNKILENFALSAAQRAAVRRGIATHCDHFFFLAIRNARRHPGAVLGALLEFSAAHPRAWMRLPQSILHLRGHRARLLSAADPTSATTAATGAAAKPDITNTAVARS